MSDSAVVSLAEVVLNCHDLEAMLTFYRDELGLPELGRAPAGQPVFLRAGEAHLAIPPMVVLVQLPPPSGAFGAPRPLHHLALEVPAERFAPECERLKARGFQLRDGVHPVVPSQTAYLDDPEGNVVELIAAPGAPTIE